MKFRNEEILEDADQDLGTGEGENEVLQRNLQCEFWGDQRLEIDDHLL